jgi:uncharacterized protein YjbI with pentapeptide repeats
MQEPKRYREGLWLGVVLATTMLVGCGLLAVQLRVYWANKKRGVQPELKSVVIPGSPDKGPQLRGARLRRASLAQRNLRKADLRGADLSGADLRAADLAGADLTGAKLGGAKLEGARYDAHTRWPSGFDPRQHGLVLWRN